ncbi:putative HTH-type transcriptional regulator [Aquicella siphonis]|uniref:Putative HTH-type transcriptional regulator n=1 Tax=Aquicella siphonis TaxID=254247 RepID=A0A5E4PGY6_9COXI|nr:LysR family transcriptional regulator [Aquicella siphonis]VVC76154.1 putative HTH-type transcriptional regulator [Aquicella siphonis]
MKLLSPQLQAFIAIAKHKTVHAAAHSLHLTQTAVTQRIRSLEKRLETTLYVRTRRGMSLTQEGLALLRYCSEAQELEGEIISSITSTGVEKNLSLCITGPYTIMHTRIIPQCMRVMREFPRLLLQFDINDNENRAATLRRGESQLAVIEKSLLSDEMEFKDLKPEHYLFVVSSKWKNRRLRDVIQTERIIDFDPQDQMTFNYLKHYSLFENANKDRYFANRTDCLAMMIADGTGYGVLPAEFAKPYLANKQLSVLNQGKSYPHQLVLAWFPRHQLPPYFSALINACE